MKGTPQRVVAKKDTSATTYMDFLQMASNGSEVNAAPLSKSFKPKPTGADSAMAPYH